MTLLTRTVHVLALGLWFGTTVFFTFVVGLTLFGGFERIGTDTANRPVWFPTPTAYGGHAMPEDLAREQGTRAAGFAVSPMFDWYFLIQSVCGAAALVTALTWARLASKVAMVHKVRTVVLLVAVASVAVGWWVEQKASHLAVGRQAASDAILATAEPTAEQMEEWRSRKKEFGAWHGVSMALNLVTLLTVTTAMALAAHLPDASAPADRRVTSEPGR